MPSGDCEREPDNRPDRLRSGVQRVARAANDQHADPSCELADDECEGIAQGLLIRVGGEQHPVALPPHALAHALGLQLTPRAPRGCRGLLDYAANTIRYDGRGDPTAVGERLAHELGHFALREACAARPHPEASVDRIAAALWMSRAAVRGALRRVGWDPELLLIELPGPPAPWVWMRAAWISERALVVWLGSERWAYAPDGRALPEGSLERELVCIVRRTGLRHRTLLGDEAFPVGPREHRGVVILLAG